jgi:hypothetical protein
MRSSGVAVPIRTLKRTLLVASQFFSADYFEARDKFLLAAKEAGAQVQHYQNTNVKGPGGEDLFTDVARIGSDKARKFVVIVSATHGNEGYCGSGCQIGYLKEQMYEARAEDTALIFVHAINPYGFAHIRRVTEDNVDINRNFIDHNQPHPANDGYDEIHRFAVPEKWADGGLEEANKALAAYGQAHGAMALQRALSGGQYRHPDGVFFGGTAPTWSNQTLRAIIKDHVGEADHVALIDFHTGLGPFGHGELILNGTYAGSYERAQSWYNNEVTSFEDGSSTSAKVTGMICFAFLDVLPVERFTGIAVEYGTYDLTTVLQAMRFDNWIHLHEKPGSALWNEGKKAMRDALYCDNDEWKAMVWERAKWVLDKCYAGLATV